MKRKFMAKKKEVEIKVKGTQLESLSQTHGKDEEKVIASTLDQVWGDDGNWRYGTLNLDEYQKELVAMAKVDLQNHATKVGIIPIDNRGMLQQRLVREFQKHVSTYTASAIPLQNKENQEEGDKVDPEIKKILSEGR